MKTLILILICVGYLYPQGNTIPRRVDTLETDVDSLYTKTSHIVNVKEFGAVGDSTTDDTNALQSAINYARNIGAKLISSGKFRITSTLTITNTRSLVWDGGGAGNVYPSGGTIIYVDIGNDTSGILITGGNDGNYIQLSNMRITSGIPSWHGDANLTSGERFGIEINYGHHGKLENLIVDGFDSCGVLLKTSYYWDIQNCFFKYNDYGFVDDEANTYILLNCHAQYNNYGFFSPDNIIGGSTQGQWFDGIYYGGTAGYRASLSNHYFESNNLSRSWGGADIKGDSLQYGQLSIDNNVYFAGTYSDYTQPTHNIKGKFVPLVINGAIRFFSVNPWYNFKFNGFTNIYDYGANPLYEAGNNTIDFTNVDYYRPANDIALDTLEINSITPSILGGTRWLTQNTVTTIITNFTGGFNGREITIFVDDTLTAFDFTGSFLIGNQEEDFIAQAGDCIKAVYQYPYWYCAIQYANQSEPYTYDLRVENEANFENKIILKNAPDDTTNLNHGDVYVDPKTNQLMMARGVNLVINGNFSDWTGDNPDDWIFTNPEDAGNYVTENPTGSCKFVVDGSIYAYGIYKDSILDSGQVYGYSFDASGVTDTVTFGVGQTPINIYANGHYRGLATAHGLYYHQVVISGLYGAATATFDNIKVWAMVGGDLESPISIHNLPYVNNFLNPTLNDTLSWFLTDKPFQIDSIKFRVDDSIGVKLTYGALGLGTTILESDTLVSGWQTITSFDDNTIDADKEVYLYFTYLGDTATFIRWKIYWRE